MRRNGRLWTYLSAAILLASLLVAHPHAWATPGQTRLSQTVPTPTPRGAPPPTARPVDATPVPPATAPAPATPAVGEIPGPSPSATAAPAPVLVLTKQVARAQVWPGATVHYTLTLTNRGNSPARQVALADTLPEGLDPGRILTPAGAAWDGRTLRGQSTILPPGGQLVVAFTAVVRPDATPGGVLLNQARASATGGQQVKAEVAVVLPPAELPPTGGCTPETGS